MLEAGTIAPDFTLPDQDGKSHTLTDYRGKWVVLYFYPKDDTPGCTKEACSFRDDLARVTDKNAVVFGVSADPVESHRTFADKYELTFPILSDPDHEALEPYGVWKEKNMYGKKRMGIERTTFLINPDGEITNVWPRVKVDGHTDKVLAEIT